MIVRILLAALIGTALLGAAWPVVDEARHDAAASEVEREANALSYAIEDIASSSDPVPRHVPGGRRDVEVTLPRGGEDAAIVVGSGQESSAMDGGGSDVVSYRTGGSRAGQIRVDAEIRVDRGDGVDTDGDGLVLRDTTRLFLRYEFVADRPTVIVSRSDRP
ncbi:MAG: hypothetical protein ABEJ55_09015 [Halanaeroarchaeum sp.]